MDIEDQGIEDEWFNTGLPEKVQLPGSMTENGKGCEITLKTKWTADVLIPE